ncbi:YjzD family protein [Oceanobacillus manasiensis]|uniref:YjzD family protein n=1 Tax=Oceanobacillus manasiensis TaxID=586413 RepID=UPI0005A678B8|nr:YjzD family protein [Oceanobacillus manasiensis]
MRYIWTIIWAFLISAALSYVLSSMGGGQFDLTGTLVFGAILSVFVFLFGEVVLKVDKSNSH